MEKKSEGYTGENTKWVELNKAYLITRGDGAAYLFRWTLLSIYQWISFKLHIVMASDDLCAHDHPWGFITIILNGGYYEWTPIDQKERGKILDERIAPDGVVEVKRWHGAGSIMYRHNNWRHSLELNTYEDTDNPVPCITFAIMGRVTKAWGFFTSFGWIYWKRYSKQKHC